VDKLLGAARPLPLSIGLVMDWLSYGIAFSLFIFFFAIGPGRGEKISGKESTELFVNFIFVIGLIVLDIFCWKMKAWALWIRLMLCLVWLPLALIFKVLLLVLATTFYCVIAGNVLAFIGCIFGILSIRQRSRLTNSWEARRKVRKSLEEEAGEENKEGLEEAEPGAEARDETLEQFKERLLDKDRTSADDLCEVARKNNVEPVRSEKGKVMRKETVERIIQAFQK
jgi:hypothetical protein